MGGSLGVHCGTIGVPRAVLQSLINRSIAERLVFLVLFFDL